MKDLVLEGYLNSFAENFGIANLLESEQFERFCIYALLNKSLKYELNLEDLEAISVGKNKGIDGIAIIINDNLIKSIEEFEQMTLKKERLSIFIYFIQSKTSTSFEDKEMGNFLDTVSDFLEKEPKYDLTEDSKIYHDIYLLLYNHMSLIKEYNLYSMYCCAGTWNENTSIAKTISIKKEKLLDVKLFNNVNIEPIDRSKLLDKFKKASNPVEAEFLFNQKVAISGIKDVNESYVGLLPFREFKKLIVEPNTDRLRNLFYDNVRDFLGIDNEVNEKIQMTLTEKKFLEFSLLNNGITVIASENSGRGDTFILGNYQIVNGCQTSNVLYECRNFEGIDDTLIPVKIITTQDEDLRDRIILSTNSQSSIKEEELLALTKFQKELEEYYSNSHDGLFYERRNNQYANRTDVKKKSIVDIREQIKSFVAMFLEEPHAVSGHFGKVFRDRKGDIFTNEDTMEPYYISGLIQIKFKDFLNSQEIERKYNKARYHVFMLFRMLIESEQFQKQFIRTKKKKSYFDSILETIRDKNKCINTFKTIFSIIDSSGIDIQNAKEIYKKSTTNTLIEQYKNTYK